MAEFSALGLHRRVSAPLWNRRSFCSSAGCLCAGSLVSPHLLGEIPTRRDGYIERIWNPMLLGARGDGRAKDTAFIQRAVDRCAEAGGGRVLLSAGHTFLSGPITLRSHVELYLEAGSTLQASPDRMDYYKTGSLLFAHGSEDVHISGTGVIDGDFRSFFPPKGPTGYSVPQPFLGPWDPLYDKGNLNPQNGRPRMILLVDCRRVLLENFTIRDSPTWTIHPVGCEDLRISGLTIKNDLDVPNCDGIDIDHCRSVRISDCNIVAGDDCLILKASRNFGDFGPCEDITITNCTLQSSSAGIKIETEGPFPLRSAVINNCTITQATRGISLLNRDGATVEDLLFTNMVINTQRRPVMWWGSGEPVAVSSVPRTRGGSPGSVRGIAFQNLICHGESGIYLRGTDGAPLRDICLRDIDLSIGRTTSFAGGFYDMRPGDAFGESGLDKRSIAGVFATETNGLTLSGITVRWQGNERNEFGAALEMYHCADVSLGQFTGEAARTGYPAQIVDNKSS